MSSETERTMVQRVPTFREIAWISAIPQLLIMAVLIGVALQLMPTNASALASGAITYLLWSRGSKAIVAAEHARGVHLLAARQFDAAIAAFQRSYSFFSRHAWIDRWRYVVVLSSSAYSYREMALCNIAFAHLQTGEVAKAIDVYRRALDEFPACALAEVSLQAIRAIQNCGAA